MQPVAVQKVDMVEKEMVPYPVEVQVPYPVEVVHTEYVEVPVEVKVPEYIT